MNMNEEPQDLVVFLKEQNPYSRALVEQLGPYVTFENYPPGENLHYEIEGQKYCYLIRSGEVTMYRESDNVLLALIQAPTLLGAGALLAKEMNLFITTSQPSEIAVLTMDEIFTLLSKHNLWETFSRQIQITLNKLLIATSRLTVTDSYGLLRAQLIELMREPENFREGITAEKYIRSKTRLSRSGVMRILSDLKAGGYIVLEDGILKKINKLPEKY
ncbi:helix-turn-helix domain-containing protein [Dryocola clanedunensis]